MEERNCQILPAWRIASRIHWAVVVSLEVAMEGSEGASGRNQ